MPTPVSWNDIHKAADRIADANPHASSVYGIPTGGAPVAVAVAHRLGSPLVETPTDGTLIVDDLVDTGATMRPYVEAGYACDAGWRKPWSPAMLAPSALVTEDWLTFPWERDGGDPTDAVTRLLQFVGEDPTREGLLDTPARVCRALTEMMDGYDKDPAEALGTTFDIPGVDELVVLSGIEFVSMCEHHMLPFTGHATVAYLPGERVVGLSKMARLVDCFAHRLQVQERLTKQIGEAMVEHLAPEAVGVIVTATHQCMTARGVRKHSPKMTTSAMLGKARTVPELRQEILALHHDQ